MKFSIYQVRIKVKLDLVYYKTAISPKNLIFLLLIYRFVDVHVCRFLLMQSRKRVYRIIIC